MGVKRRTVIHVVDGLHGSGGMGVPVHGARDPHSIHPTVMGCLPPAPSDSRKQTVITAGTCCEKLHRGRIELQYTGHKKTKRAAINHLLKGKSKRTVPHYLRKLSEAALGFVLSTTTAHTSQLDGLFRKCNYNRRPPAPQH
ncbi:Hypothetical predicted protein [Podarcis lilfordi]|uniref:Uncharacterized protein n=1 Tax=Podarcis lilfordi TaxID=74358 RepID=A0AA35K1H6_9SAUR|nr:Hypothetical predicted protein [Podarcis lilfordi]